MVLVLVFLVNFLMFLDLDNYVEFKSISRAGFNFSPDKLLPRCEILKMRPKLLAEKHKEQNELKKLKEQEEREALDVKAANYKDQGARQAKKIIQQLERLMKNTSVRNLDKLKELEVSAREYTSMAFEFNKHQ